MSHLVPEQEEFDLAPAHHCVVYELVDTSRSEGEEHGPDLVGSDYRVSVLRCRVHGKG